MAFDVGSVANMVRTHTYPTITDESFTTLMDQYWMCIHDDESVSLLTKAVSVVKSNVLWARLEKQWCTGSGNKPIQTIQKSKWNALLPLADHVATIPIHSFIAFKLNSFWCPVFVAALDVVDDIQLILWFINYKPKRKERIDACERQVSFSLLPDKAKHFRLFPIN
eukprot:198215_1